LQPLFSSLRPTRDCVHECCATIYCVTIASMAEKSRAEYYRGYRKTVKPMNEREARDEGFRAGVEACVKVIRERGADKALTGYQMARLLERVTGQEPYEVTARRALVKNLQPAS
jgi:hypothetical protein